jgi:hypothetical protein
VWWVVPALVLAFASVDAAGAAGRFPSRERALEREHVVEESGNTTVEYRVGSPSRNTTFDLRELTSTAYPFEDSFPLGFGGDDPGVRTVVIGASIVGQAPTDWTWDDFDEELGDVGAALRMVGVEYVVSYDIRVDNVFDGFRPRPADDDPTTADFLIEGCHMTYIRDDAVENDRTMSGVIKDCLFDGINMGVSEQKGDDYPNPTSVVGIQNSVFIFRPMPHDKADDGKGHARMFKWSSGGGSVDMRKVVICYRETPLSLGSSSFDEWPRGDFDDVTVVLGPAYDGDQDGSFRDRDHPGRAPRGVAVTRDWSVCNRARSAWLDAH